MLDKKVFILNDIPEDVSYIDEIKSLEPVCLYGDLENIPS